ncbi:MAG TPA: hypothetical protein VFN60_07465 [Acidimicrobiales bacterium]|nr:hypothetical protein [Acidimicrobiales bacterium]
MNRGQADDRERLVGVVAAPMGALIDFIVVGVLAARARYGHLPGGATRYEGLEIVLLGLAVAALAAALLRRRTVLGASLGLQGLALFDLRFWGFAIPFVVAGAWLLVRAYRSRAAEAGPGDAARRPAAERRLSSRRS